MTFKGPFELDTLIHEGTSHFYDHLASVSISMWLSGQHCLDIDLQSIRNFLTPQDSVVRNIMANQIYTEVERAEFTCDWFAPRLRKFMKSTGATHSLLITGAACTGKTILARWIHEKLQETVVDEPYDVIFYSVDAGVKYTTSPLSLVKSLLLQVLDRKVGRMQLISQINKAMIQARQGTTENEVEDSLWSALHDALEGRKLLILVDGLDQLSGRSGNPVTLEKLSKVTKGKVNIKTILLSRPLSDSARKHCQEHLALEDAKQTGGDIRHRIEDFLEDCEEFGALKEAEKAEIVQKHVEMSKGSFLWGELQLASLKHGASAADILKAYQNAPKSVEEYIDQLINKLDWKRSDTKRFLSWMMAAERPFTLKELKSLIEVDLDGCAYRPFSGDIEAFAKQLCGSLIVVRDNLVTLRHPSIRQHLVAATAKGPKAINIKDAHRELATRALAYVKIHLLQNQDLDPQADPHIVDGLDRDFHQLALFEYASRYWVSHFRASSLYDPATNKFTLSDNFKACFSNTTKFALYEGTCLARQYVAVQAEILQTLSMALRKTLFGETSPAYLQSLLLELHVARGFKDAHFLSNVAYEAFSVSRNVCSSAVVQTLAEAFIECSAPLRVSEHVEYRAKKIEVLRYLIEIYKHEHVEMKQIVYLGYLAELYVDIKEIQQAVVIYRQLYRLRLQAHGHLHEHTLSLFHVLISYMKHLSLHDEVLELSLEYHQYIETHLAVTDQRRIDSTLVIVQCYEDRKDYFRAEQTLVRYWKSVSCAKSSSRIMELKIEFGLKYTEFLHRHSRKEECEVILRGLWTEIQSYSYEYRFQSTMIKRVQTIAEYFSKLEIFTMSRSIYQSLYEYYESREERTSTECLTIVRSLAETVTRSFSYSKTVSSSSTTTTTTTSTTVISKEERKTLTEIFESSLESTEISSTTIAICQALCSSYTYEEKYEEACETYFRVISKVWASIEQVSVSIDITEITEHLTVEILELCVSFAECHFKLLHIDHAEAIYLNIFRALICVRHIENKGFLLAKIKTIIAFFEMTYKFERVIEIYRELFIWMPIFFGKTHHETITILIAFARICFRLGLYEEACTACFYVYSHFHIAHGCLSIDGFAAAILLAEIYEIQCKWHLAYEVYGYLWRTFCHYGVEYKIDACVIQKIYERYIFILEHKEHCEFDVLIQVAKEFRHHSVILYKHHHEVTVRATLAYAHYCEQREEHHETAVSLYQQVIKYCKTTKTEFTQKTLHTCNRRVAKIYSSSTKEISKAVEIYHEEFEMCKTSSWTSTETLTALSSYVSTCKKQSTTESITKATETLKTSTLEIFKQNCSTETLISSAQSIGKTYKECGFTEQAQSLVVEMRSKLVDEVRTSVTTSKECSHSSYVFLASFQETISDSSSFSSVMAEIREEILLYQSYFSATKVQKDVRSILVSGCGLYFHLQSKKECHSEFLKIKQELTAYFTKYLNFKQTVKESVMDLFFQLYIKEASKTHYGQEVVKHAEISVLNYTKTGKYAEAYDLVLLIDRFIHMHGGFHCEFYVRVGFNLAKYLVGVGTTKCGDQKLYATMFNLSIMILQEALQGLDLVEMELHELQQLLADLIVVLSEQKNYTDLEVSNKPHLPAPEIIQLTSHAAHPPSPLEIPQSPQQPLFLSPGPLHRPLPHPNPRLPRQIQRSRPPLPPYPLQPRLHPWRPRQVDPGFHQSPVRTLHPAETLRRSRRAA